MNRQLVIWGFKRMNMFSNLSFFFFSNSNRYGILRIVVAGGILLGLFSTAQAQSDFSQRFSSNQPVNPAHEQIKIEAEEAYQQGDYRKTIELTSNVLRQNPQDHVAFYLRGSGRVELGQAQRNSKTVRDGIEDARQAIALGGSENAIYYLPYLYGMTNLSRLEGRKTHAEAALKVADQVLDSRQMNNDERSNLLYQRANTQVYLQNFDQAIDDFSEAVRLNPQHLGARIGLAEAYVAAGNHQQALEAYNQTVDAFSDNPLVYNNRGMYLQERGNLQAALGDFTRAIELDRNYFVSHTNRGFALMEKGDPQAAEESFTASLQINPNQPMVYSLRGTARLSQGRVETALSDYRRVTELDPESPVAHADLGFAQFFARDYSSARQSFNRAMEGDSQMRYLEPWLYWSLVLEGNEDQARSRFASVTEKESEKPDWTDRLLVYSLGESTEKELLESVEATEQRTKAAQLCEAHFFIGQRKSHSGKEKEAREHFQKALESDESDLSAYRGAQYALGEFSK